MRTWRAVGKTRSRTSRTISKSPPILPPPSSTSSRGRDLGGAGGFTATIFDLARRGFLEIEDRTEEKPASSNKQRPSPVSRSRRNSEGKTTAAAVRRRPRFPGGGRGREPSTTPGPPPAQLGSAAKPSSASAARGAAPFRRPSVDPASPARFPRGDGFSLDELKSWLKKNPAKFQAWFRAWGEAIKAEGKALAFIEPESLKRRNRFIAVTAPAAVLTANPILGVLGAVLIPKIKRRSMRWARENEMWKALRRFLDDFSEFKETPPEAYRLWEQYLVFGILFGNAKKILKSLPLILGDERAAVPAWYAGASRQAFLSGGGIGSIASMVRSIESAATSIQLASTAAAHYSSGGGGGFSGGERAAAEEAEEAPAELFLLRFRR